MDLWDVAKVMWRRRWVAAPLLLLTIAASVFSLLAVAPDYEIEGQVGFVPPAKVSGGPKSGETQVTNPWTVGAMADDVMTYLNRADVRRNFKSRGFSDNFTVTLAGYGLQIIKIDVIGKTPQQAMATLTEVINAINGEVELTQSSLNLDDGAKVSLKVLDSGQEVKVARTVGKRTLIVIAAVGLIISVSISLWVDALIRRRAYRAAVPATRAAVPVANAANAPTVPMTNGVPPIVVQPSASQLTADDNDRTIILPLAGISWSSAAKPKKTDSAS